MHVRSLLRMQLALMSQERSWFHHDSLPRFQIMAYVLIVLFHVGDSEHRREDDTWRFLLVKSAFSTECLYWTARSYRSIDEIHFDALAVKGYKFDRQIFWRSKTAPREYEAQLLTAIGYRFWISILTVARRQAVAKCKTNKIRHMKKKVQLALFQSGISR